MVTLFVTVLFVFEYWVSLVQRGYECLIWDSSLETKSIETNDVYDNLLYLQRVLCLCVNIQAVISEVIPNHKCDLNMGLCSFWS
jgi:hypothetical protein